MAAARVPQCAKYICGTHGPIEESRCMARRKKCTMIKTVPGLVRMRRAGGTHENRARGLGAQPALGYVRAAPGWRCGMPPVAARSAVTRHGHTHGPWPGERQPRCASCSCAGARWRCAAALWRLLLLRIN